jgi:CHAT domain-containing protein
MNILNRLFRRKSKPQQLLDALAAFIQADSWPGSLRLVQDHPELLTPEALLAQLAAAQNDDNDFAHPFHWAVFTYTGV